ncbi:hypothetical protein Ahia01_000845300, partial [Argonauta hians]
MRELHYVLWRSWITLIRDPASIRFRTIHTIIVAILLGLIYFRQELNQQTVMNINGLLFVILMNIGISSQFMVINTFPSELPVLVQEFKSKIYSIHTYFISKTLADIPIQIVLPILFNLIVYWMTGLRHDFPTFIFACLILIINSNIAASFGFLLSAITGNVTRAVAFS